MIKDKNDLIYADECYQIMGMVFEVYNQIGPGHKEKFYQKAISGIFRENRIDFREQLKAKLKYKEKDLGIYILDFLVFNKIVLEIKKRNYFSKKDIDQLYAYLRATGLKLGIIIHFTNVGVKYKRIVNLR